MPEVWRRGAGESIPAAVPGSTLATGATERRCSPQKGVLVPPQELRQTAEPRCPHTPTPFVSCQRPRGAASSRAAAVGGAISSAERTSSHLPACRVRVRAQITARRPCRGLAPCRHRLISPHSPHDTFVCLPWGPVLWRSLGPRWHRGAWAGCPTLSSPWDTAVLLRASHGRGRKDSRLSHFAGDTQVSHAILASRITAQRPRAGLPWGSLPPCPALSEIFSIWLPSSQYQEWPCYCCARQEAMALISWSLSPCFLGLSISRYLSKN